VIHGEKYIIKKVRMSHFRGDVPMLQTPQDFLDDSPPEQQGLTKYFNLKTASQIYLISFS